MSRIYDDKSFNTYRITLLNSFVKRKIERKVIFLQDSKISPPRMRTIRQAARETGFPENAIRRLVKEDAIVYVRCGSKVLVNLDRFIEFLNEGGNHDSKSRVSNQR